MNRTKWIVGGLAFLLPLLVGIGIDVYAGSAAADGSNVVTLFACFIASVVVAAGVTAGMIMTAPVAIARRLAFAGLVWIALFVEVSCTLFWLLRGID